MPEVRVKVCCIKSPTEIEMAVRHGATALGLVSSMPSGPGTISDEFAAELAAQVPSGIDSFLLTSLQSAVAIIEQHQRIRTTTLQIVDRLEEGSYLDIREALPEVKIVQVIHVLDRSSIEEPVTVGAHVDAILLDSGNPHLATKELGGTGRAHDWSLSREIVQSVTKPVYLAGGLHAGNIREAIETVRPYGVDICSGVRNGDELDEGRLSAFMAVVRDTLA